MDIIFIIMKKSLCLFMNNYWACYRSMFCKKGKLWIIFIDKSIQAVYNNIELVITNYLTVYFIGIYLPVKGDE